MSKIYSTNHYKFIDQIVLKKRKAMLEVMKKNLIEDQIEDAIDIGTTKDKDNKSSNYIIKNLNHISKISSLSDQKINDKFFFKNFQKSITDEFSNYEISNIKSDLVISSATIEHVGSFKNQIKMIQNIILLTKKVFIITTPNRFHPIEFHTKLILLHWLPKKKFRNICKFLGLNYFSNEKNLNLLSKKDLINLMKLSNFSNYKIYSVKFFGFVSNYILIGRIKN